MTHTHFVNVDRATDAESTIRRLVALVDVLPSQARTLWDQAKREFSIGLPKQPLWEERQLSTLNGATAHVRVECTPRGYRIVLRNRRWARSVFMTVWLAVWVVGGVAAIGGILMGHHLAPAALAFIALWVAGWVSGGIAIACLILWQTVGSEELVLDDKQLTIVRKVGVAVQTRSYSVAGIENMRLQVRRSRAKGYDFLVRVLAFEYSNTSVRLRIPLSRDEGEKLLAGPLKGLVRHDRNDHA